MSTNGKQHADLDPVPRGMGTLFADGHKFSGEVRHLRGDARLAARILSCGVVEPEQMANLMAGMFEMAVNEIKKGDKASTRNITALLRIFEVAAKLEQDERKLQLAAEQGTQPEGYTGVGSMPVIEVVVKNRDEVQQFSDIRDQLVETLANQRIDGKHQGGSAAK